MAKTKDVNFDTLRMLPGETQEEVNRLNEGILALAQVDTAIVYAVCPVCTKRPVNPACFVLTPIIAAVMHTIYYCEECFNAHIRPWARSAASTDKVFNKID